MTMKNKISLFCLSGGIWYLGETVVLSNLFKSLFLFVNYQSSIIKLKSVDCCIGLGWIKVYDMLNIQDKFLG